MARGREEKKKNYVSPFVDASGKQISVLLSASVKRFGVSRMQDFFASLLKIVSHCFLTLRKIS